MKLRVAKKVLKNQDKLQYNEGQIKKAETIAGRVSRRVEKNKKA